MSFTMPAQNTSNITEGTNLYYTNARADARIAAASTSDLSEGTNLYYTDARADARVALIVDSAPGTLNTLNELAAALGDDANFSTTVTNSIATKLPLAGGALTGAVTTNSTFDGRNVSVDGAKLDGIEAGATADQTAAQILTAIKTVDGSGSGLDADLLDGINSGSFLRSDASDTVGNGVTYTWASTNTEGLRFTNSSYAKSLYIGGWSGSNTAGISRIRNSNDNLHIDSGANGHIYLNNYSTGTTYIRGQTAWHAGNDGAGSGLDADLLDGQQGSYYTNASNLGSGTVPDARLSSNVHFVTTSASTPGNGNLSIGYDGSTYSYVQSHSSKPLRLNPAGNAVQIGSGNTAWHSGNDGSGSGLDADLLDGQQGSYYLPVSSTVNGYARAQGRVVTNVNDAAYRIPGMYGFNNVPTNGPGTNYSAMIVAANSDVGLQIVGGYTNNQLYFRGWHSSGGTYLGWNKVWHSTNDGSGSGLDADLLDGYNTSTSATANTVVVREGSGHIYGNYILGSYFNASSGNNENPTIGQVWTQSTGDNYLRKSTPAHFKSQLGLWHTGNDGSGSGLDADLLDGQQGSYYAPASHNHSGVYLPISGKAADSNLLDGLDSAAYLRDDGWNTSPGQDANTQTGMRSDFTYSNNAPNTGELIRFGAGNYSTQFNTTYGSTSNFHFRTRNGDNATWGSWAKMWHSLSDGSGSGLDADLLDGQHGSYYTNPTTLPNGSNLNTAYGVTAGVGNGLKFWNGNDAYKISMGDSAEYKYGPVTDYSIKTVMDSNSSTRGFTWGTNGGTPIAALNVGNGNMQIGGTFASSGATFTGQLIINNNIASPANYYNGLQVEVRATSGTAGIGLHRNGYSHVGIYTNASNRLDFDFNSGDVIMNYNAGTLWGSGNDGSGSGLDADLLDGQQGSYYYAASNPSGYQTGSGTVAQSHYVSGNAFATTGSPSSVLEYQQASGQSDTRLAPSTDWHNSIRMGHGNPYNYYGNTIAMRMTGGGSGTMFTQHISNNNVQGWRTQWDSGNDGAGSGLDADLLDGQHASAFQAAGSYLTAETVSSTNTVTITGAKYFLSNRNTTSNSPPLQVYSTGNTGAIMSFHRSGYYAVNMGLDSDNVFRIGGWSAATNRFVMDMSGNLTMAGNITAYSDSRLKENVEVIENALSKVQAMRGVTFTRNDVEDKEERHAGVIAQEVEVVFPEVVSENNEGIKNVAYGNMVGLLIEAVKELKQEVEDLKTQLKEK